MGDCLYNEPSILLILYLIIEELKEKEVMKNICILFIVFILSGNIAMSQSSRLTKTGYLNVEKVFEAVLEDETLEEAVYKIFEKEAAKTGEKKRSGSKEVQKEIQNRMARAILVIVRREGYTLIMERTETTILYADRDFDITTQVIALVRESILRG